MSTPRPTMSTEEGYAKGLAMPGRYSTVTLFARFRG
jgi:hypothetical protein